MEAALDAALLAAVECGAMSEAQCDALTDAIAEDRLTLAHALASAERALREHRTCCTQIGAGSGRGCAQGRAGASPLAAGGQSEE